MKLLLLLLLPFLSFAQTAPKPFSKANVVVIQTPDSAAVALRKFATILVAQGYTVDKLDNQFLTLLTTPKVIPARHNPGMVVRVAATPGASSSLRVSGEYKLTALGTTYSDAAQYYGAGTSVNKLSFTELQKAALAYPAGQVTYLKQ